MGSFAFTCGVSRLAISAGTPVRYILLSSGPYVDEGVHSFNSLWFPRSFPIKAEYNDYGNIENAEEGIGRDLIQEAFKIDLKSVGVGNNSAHDVATSKDMDWESLLDAIQEGRVRVSQNVDRGPGLEKRLKEHNKIVTKKKATMPKGVPTMQRVRKALTKGGLTISPGGSHEGYLVDKKGLGIIRVRCAGYGVKEPVKQLEKAQACLGEFATVIKAGTGSYRDAADLMVFCPPGVDDYSGMKDPDRSLRVQPLMIREDVWQALLATPTENHFDHTPLTIDDHRKLVVEVYEKCLEHMKKIDDLIAALPEEGREDHARSLGSLRMMLGSDFKHPVAPWLEKDEVPFTVGMGTNWRLLVEKKLPVEQVQHVLDAVAEMIHVVKVLMPVRWHWMPSHSIGPQFGEWGAHVKFFETMLDVARSIKKEDDEERAKWDTPAEATV